MSTVTGYKAGEGRGECMRESRESCLLVDSSHLPNLGVLKGTDMSYFNTPPKFP